MITIYWYYALTVFLGCCYLMHARVAYKTLLISIPLTIALLLSTGLDYDHYKFDYETGFSSFRFPFFYTKGGLTAEPFYKIYTGFIRVITDLDFAWFLAINFYVCFLLFWLYSPFKRIKNSYIHSLFWLFFLPVIIPTVFYFSPRSSLSFFLTVSGLFLLVNERKLMALVLFTLAISTHSQFIPIVFFLLIVSVSLNRFIKFKSRYAYLYLILYGFSLILFLKVAPFFLLFLSSVLSFLPSADIAINKLHYIHSADSGFRVTSILSLAVFPCLIFTLYKYQSKMSAISGLKEEYVWKFVFYLAVCVVFGFCTNLVYFDTPHLSGRLSRFSDYVSLGLLMPITLLCFFSLRVVIFIGLLFIIAAPFIYPTVYSIH